jgi:hypothetical protein
MKTKKIFKITCEFYIKAKDESEVEEILKEDSDFVENHCMIEETNEKINKEEIFNS